MKIRKTKSAEVFQIVDGALLIEGDNGGLIHDELFIANLEDDYTKSVRVISLNFKPMNSAWDVVTGWFEWEVNMQFTLRAEMRGNFKRWEAYRRTNGKLHKVYVGRTEDITIDRLIEVAKKL